MEAVSFLFVCSNKDIPSGNGTPKKHQRAFRRSFTGKSARVITCLLAISFMGACSSRIVRDPTPLSDPVVQTQPYTQQEYIIQPGDSLEVKFFYNRELNELVTVRPDGRISLQLAQEVIAAGKTPEKLTEELKEQYSRHLENPEITVIVRSFAGQKVFVGGEVNRPGIIDLTRSLTVLQSIFAAWGMKDTARPTEVIVIRRVEKSKPLVISVDLSRAIDGTDTEQDISLMPYDVVFVPRSSIANVNLFVEKYIRNVIPLPVTFGFSYDLNPDQNN